MRMSRRCSRLPPLWRRRSLAAPKRKLPRRICHGRRRQDRFKSMRTRSRRNVQRLSPPPSRMVRSEFPVQAEINLEPPEHRIRRRRCKAIQFCRRPLKRLRPDWRPRLAFWQGRKLNRSKRISCRRIEILSEQRVRRRKMKFSFDKMRCPAKHGVPHWRKAILRNVPWRGTLRWHRKSSRLPARWKRRVGMCRVLTRMAALGSGRRISRREKWLMKSMARGAFRR